MVTMDPPPGTSPLPVFAGACKLGTDRIAFHIFNEGKEIFFLIYKERLISPLVQMTTAVGFSFGVYFPSVSIRETVHEYAKITVPFRIEYQMPVIRHEDIGKETHTQELFRIDEKLFKEPVIIIVIENLHETVGTVNHMVQYSSDIDAGTTGHATTLHYSKSVVTLCM